MGDSNDLKLRQLRILAVDDLNLDLFLLTRIWLPRLEGITVKETLSANDGVESLKKHQAGEKIDLILMNLYMPRMDGFEAARRIRNTDSDVIIIACTEYSYESIAARLHESGFNGYLKKPLELKALQELVNKFFGTVSPNRM